jgi:hypothetical protein
LPAEGTGSPPREAGRELEGRAVFVSVFGASAPCSPAADGGISRPQPSSLSPARPADGSPSAVGGGGPAQRRGSQAQGVGGEEETGRAARRRGS